MHRLSVQAALLAAALLLHAAPVRAQTLYLDAQFGFTLTTGVVYATMPVGDPATGLDLRLELYEPTGPGLPALRPAIVAIHGGGFTGGSRFSGTMLGLCERMAQRGYTCVSIDYRLLGDQPVVAPAYQAFESAIALADPTLAPAIAASAEDTVTAMQWLVDNAATLGIDPARITLAGYSAGGALTAFVGYLLDETGITLPAEPRLTFNMSGAFDLVVQAIAPGDAALLMSHGDADTTVPISGAYALRDQAIVAGVPHELHVLSGLGHAVNIFTEEVAPGETVFERFVAYAYVHAALPVAVPGLLGPGALALAAAMAGLGVRRLHRG